MTEATEPAGPTRRPWLIHAATLLVLYVAAFVVRDDAAQHRVSAGHGDVAAYFHVAKNLFAGRGFVQDFVADFLQDPDSVPTASNTWWLPLPTIIAYLGMEAAGEPTFVAAKAAMIAVASLVVIVCYFAGLLLIGGWAAATAVGLLGVGFHLYLDQPTVTLSHGPYSVFAAAALLCVLAYPRHPRVLPLFGLCFGLTYLCRGDSQMLVVSLALTMLVVHFLKKRPRPSIPWKGIAACGALFLAVVGPWWVRNLSALGEPMPSGVKKVMWARNYEDWFTDASHLTRENYFDWGMENILRQKKIGVVDALEYTPGVMYRSVVREGRERADVMSNPGHPKRRVLQIGLYVLTPLMALGLLWLLIRRPWAVALMVFHLLLLVAVYGVLFPGVGRESYRSSMFSVFPILLTAVVAALWLLLWPLRKVSLRLHGATLLVTAAALSGANVWAAKPHLRDKARNGVEGLLAPYREFGRWWSNNAGPDAVFFVRNPWEFTAETELRSVMLPNVAADQILQMAKRFGVTYIVDEGSQGLDLSTLRPGAARLIERGDVIQIPNAPAFKLYRILPRKD